MLKNDHLISAAEDEDDEDSVIEAMQGDLSTRDNLGDVYDDDEKGERQIVQFKHGNDGLDSLIIDKSNRLMDSLEAFFGVIADEEISCGIDGTIVSGKSDPRGEIVAELKDLNQILLKPDSDDNDDLADINGSINGFFAVLENITS